MSVETVHRFAAVVYPPRVKAVGFLARLAARVRVDGYRVAGIVQEHVTADDGTFLGIDAVDVATGRRVPIKRSDTGSARSAQCALDTRQLAETSPILRAAVAERPDLIVLDKFGIEEQNGRGLTDEIMAILSEGIPFLISVPEPVLGMWRDRTGELGDELAMDDGALDAWWATVRGSVSRT